MDTIRSIKEKEYGKPTVILMHPVTYWSMLYFEKFGKRITSKKYKNNVSWIKRKVLECIEKEGNNQQIKN